MAVPSPNASRVSPSGPLSQPGILSGTGSPLNVVEAPMGTMYLRTDGAANTTLYLKTSGAANTSTGWTAVSSA